MNVETLLMLVTPSCQVLDLKKFSFDVTLIFSRVHKKTMFQKTKYWVRLMGSKEVEHPGERCTLYCLLREQGPLTISNVWFTVFPHIVSWIVSSPWIVSSSSEETIQISLHKRKINVETRYMKFSRFYKFKKESFRWKLFAEIQ